MGAIAFGESRIIRYMNGMSVLRNVPVMLVAALLSAAAAPLHGAGPTSYEAVFSDGTRLEGERITGWGGAGDSPRLDATSLQDPKRPLRWLRNLRLEPWCMPAAGSEYIEFVGGDRIVGRVVGSRASSEVDGVRTPAHFLVVPATSSRSRSHSRSRSRSPKTMRVLLGAIRRIVMTPTPRSQYLPGRLFRREGQSVDFIGIRPGDDSLNLLLSNGAIDLKLSNVAEIHFPRVDPWQAYFRILGVMNPACRSRMVRYETVGGTITTAGTLRTLELPFASDSLKQKALDHLRRQDEHIVRQEKDIERYEKAIVSARADYIKESTRVAQQIKTARQAYEKAVADLKKRIEKDKKSNPGRSDEERAKLARQRRKQLSDFEARELQKIKRVESDNSKLTGRAKSKVDRAISTLEKHKLSIIHAKERRGKSVGVKGDSTTWSHVIQPVWSLDALRIPFKSIYMRWSFAPDRVPLSMIHPTASVSPPLQPWHADRDAYGRFLHSGGRKYCWGFGVHAYSELIFTLPRSVNSFQAGLGLDRIVAAGGCARARVFLGSTEKKPLYASPLLIGSKKTVDTGPIAIRSAGEGPRRLILQADTAHHGRPSGTDPLNIRDKLNWLEPLIGFDTAALQEVIWREAIKQLPAWKGWTVKFDKRGRYTWTSRLWNDKRVSERSTFLPMIRAEKHPLVFSRQITVGPRDNWLTVDAGVFSPEDAFQPQNIALRIDDNAARPQPLPIRQNWQTRDAAPSFDIGRYRGKKITIEMTQPAGGPRLFWHRASISNDLSGEYRLARLLKKVGKPDMKVPRGVGWGLQSGALDDPGRLALLDVYALGAVVNFWNPTVRSIGANELGNVLVGAKWTGGDKGLETVAKIGGLKTLFLAGDAGVSPAAVEKLKGSRPDMTVRHFDHTPSALYGKCHLVIKNTGDKDVVVHWVHFSGKLVRAWKMTPNATVHNGSGIGCRYQAYIDDKLAVTYTVAPPKDGKAYVVWEIKRK